MKANAYDQELLTIFMEECSEAIMEASKVIRFDQGYDRLEAEIGDLYCMLNLMHERDMFSWSNVEDVAQHKREKLKQWSGLLGENDE